MGKLSRFILGFVLVLSPLVLGSNRAIFWALNAMLVAIAVLFYVIAEWGNLKKTISDWNLPTHLAVLYFMPMVWMIFQLLPGMPRFLAHPVWQSVPEAAASVSIDPTQTALALLWWLAMGTCFIALRAGTKRGGVQFYLNLILCSVSFVAVFGLASYFMGWDSVGIQQKSEYLGWLTGTFVNRNSAASYFVIGLAIATVQLQSSYWELVKRHQNVNFAAQLFLLISSKATLYISCLIVILVALLLTGSRAGILSGICTIGMITLLSGMVLKKRSYKFPLVIFIGGLLIVLSTNTILERANGGANSSWTRIELALDAGKATLARPILGHGAGAYQSVEPLYRSENLPQQLVWNRAHNSLLEAFVDLGVPFTLVWLFVFSKIIAQILRSLQRSTKIMPASTVFLTLFVCEGVHALVDFSLQIQSIALALSAILGVAIGEVMLNRSKSTAK